MAAKNPKDEPALLNVKKAAAYLGVSPSAIRQWALSGKLVGLKVGSRGDWRFTKEKLSKLTTNPIERKKLDKIKKYLLQHAKDIEKEATMDHLRYLGPEYMRIEAIQKYMAAHIRILKSIIHHIESKSLESATQYVKKLGDLLATNAIKDGLSIQEATNGIIYLKQAIWKSLNKAGLLHELSTKDYHKLSQTMGILIDTTSSQIAFSYSALSKRQSEVESERLQKLFQEAPAFICILKGNKHIYEMSNKLHDQLIGFRDIIGKPVREALPEIEQQGFIKLLDNVLKTGKTSSNNELKVKLQRRKNAPLEILYINIVYQPIVEANGMCSGIFIHGIDVTDQVRSRKKLEKSKQLIRLAKEESDRQKRLYEAITSNTPDLIYVFDLQYKFTFANEALLNMWGRTWKNSIGKRLSQLGYEPWHAQMHEQEIDHIIKTKQTVRGIVSFPHATLGRREYDYILTPVFNKKGDIEAIAGITRDITEIKNLSKQKDEFIGIASHELKTPVTSIKAFAQVLQNRFNKAGDHTSANYLKKMDAQLNKLTSLIGDLLDVTKIETGKLQFHENEFDFHSLVNEIAEEMQRTTTKHTIVPTLKENRIV
nr:PAS domain-containing protein [Candidatus Woesebacteria bacterium]